MGGRGNYVVLSEGINRYDEWREEDLNYDEPHEVFIQWRRWMRNEIQSL